MKKAYYIATVLLLASICEGWGQEELTQAQSQYIISRSKSKVKTYADYLELLGKTDVEDVENREFYKQTIYLSFGKEGSKTRVHNDLIPPAYSDKAVSEANMQLESYLNKIADYYGDSLTVRHLDLETSDVYYAPNEKWFFVKVTANRTMDGVFRFGNEQINNKRQDKVDFYFNASLVGAKVVIGGIYAIQPHSDKEFTKAKIVSGSDQGINTLLIGKPLKFQSETVKSKFKRNKEYVIKWEGGLPDDIVRLELISKDTLGDKGRKVFTPMLNSNSFSFVPTSADKLGTYQFRLHNLSTGRYTQSSFFDIRRKVPLGATVGAAAALVTGAVILYLSRDDGGTETGIEDPLAPE